MRKPSKIKTSIKIVIDIALQTEDAQISRIISIKLIHNLFLNCSNDSELRPNMDFGVSEVFSMGFSMGFSILLIGV